MAIKTSYKIFFFSKASGGGIDTFFKQIDSLDKKTFTKNFYLYKKNSPRSSNRGYRIINKNYPESNSFSLYKTVLFCKNIIATHRLLVQENPALVFSSDQYSSIILLLIKTLFLKRLKVVCLLNTNLTFVIRQKPNFIYRFALFNLFKMLLIKADLLIAVSQELSRSIVNYFDLDTKKVKVIFNAVDTSEITKSKLSKTNLDKTIKIITAGRLDEQKDYETIFKALQLVKNASKRIVLYILGDGPLKNALLRKSKQLNLSDNVRFLGWRKNINPLLSNADFFVFSSNYEGFGRVIIEAMARGLPIIATDTPYGPSEILGKGKYGLLVPMRDKQNMATAMMKLIENPKLRRKYAALSYKRAKNFYLKAKLKDYQTVFMRVINK